MPYKKIKFSLQPSPHYRPSLFSKESITVLTIHVWNSFIQRHGMARKIECENLNILKISLLRMFKKQASKNMDWKDGAVVKNDCYADRGQDSSSQHQCEEADN